MLNNVLQQLPKPQPITSPPLANPNASGVVGVPFYYAVTPEHWDTIAPSVTSNGATITITATPTQLIFDPADGTSPQTCATAGSRVTSHQWAKTHAQQVCAYTYQHSSPTGNNYAANLSIRRYLEVETTGIDPNQITGRIDDYIDTTTELPIPIVEIQAVLR